MYNILFSAVKFEGTPISLSDKETVAVSRASIHGSPRHRSKYLATLEKICKILPSISENTSVPPPPAQTKTIPSNEKALSKKDDIAESNGAHADVEKMKTSKPELIKRKKEIEVEKVIPKLSAAGNENGSSDNGDIITKLPVIPKKSELKLELSNKSAPEKPQQPKTVTLCSNSKTIVSHKKTVTKSLGKRSSSKTSILDDPIAIGEKSNKGGGSCPSLPIVRPPNILVYSDSAVTRENIARTLRNVLDPDR